MYNLKTSSALVAFYLSALAFAANSSQPLTQGQGQGTVLTSQSIRALSCQNARDAAIGGTSSANILLANALISASPFDASVGTAGAIAAAQNSLAPSQLALSRIQSSAIQGQAPNIQDMELALAGFNAAAQNVNTALALSSASPAAGATGLGANASRPVLAQEMVPVVTNLGPENKALIVNLNTAGSQLTQSNVGNSALQLQEVQLAMRVMMNCTGTTLSSSGNNTSTGTGTGSTGTGGLTGSSSGNSTGTFTGSTGQSNGTSGGLLARRSRRTAVVVD